jgi:hypothetical protein
MELLACIKPCRHCELFYRTAHLVPRSRIESGREWDAHEQQCSRRPSRTTTKPPPYVRFRTMFSFARHENLAPTVSFTDALPPRRARSSIQIYCLKSRLKGARAA